MARSTFFYHQKRLTAPDKHAELKQAIRDSFQRNKGQVLGSGVSVFESGVSFMAVV